MIPAILSYVYVIYLYRKLNSAQTTTLPDSASDENVHESVLLGRIHRLELRLNQLFISESKKETLS